MKSCFKDRSYNLVTRSVSAAAMISSPSLKLISNSKSMQCRPLHRHSCTSCDIHQNSGEGYGDDGYGSLVINFTTTLFLSVHEALI